jgi:hypothetical protein
MPQRAHREIPGIPRHITERGAFFLGEDRQRDLGLLEESTGTPAACGIMLMFS